MNEYELSGSYYEMGRQYGAILKREGFSPPPASPEALRKARENEAVVREQAPELLDELRGIADAGGFDRELIKVLPLTLDADTGCSVVAVAGEHTADGRPLFGRNYDFLASFQGYGVLYRTRPEGRLSHVGCSDHWVGRWDGVNEAGLAIGQSGPPPNGSQPGFLGTLVARVVLDTCRTVAQAATFLENVPHTANNAFLIADATGDIAGVDTSTEEVLTTRLTGGLGTLANHFTSEAMAVHEPDEPVPTGGSRARKLRDWFEGRSGFGIRDIQRVLADPEAGVCQLDGEGEEDDPVITHWSWTAVLGEPEIHLAKGTPNETPYAPVAF
jgi:predicted choloylglycine hydrolase